MGAERSGCYGSRDLRHLTGQLAPAAIVERITWFEQEESLAR